MDNTNQNLGKTSVTSPPPIVVIQSKTEEELRKTLVEARYILANIINRIIVIGRIADGAFIEYKPKVEILGMKENKPTIKYVEMTELGYYLPIEESQLNVNVIKNNDKYNRIKDLAQLPPIGTKIKYTNEEDEHQPMNGCVVAHKGGAEQDPIGGVDIVLENGIKLLSVKLNRLTHSGNYELVNEPLATAEEVMELLRKAEQVRQEKLSKQQQEKDEYGIKLEKGQELAKKLFPAGTKAVLVAELRQDESDSMSDYFGSKTVKMVVLATSTHTRDLFKEMRKAAKNFKETEDMAVSGHELRHKYSMGDGYSLSQSDRTHASGWKIRKYSSYEGKYDNRVYLSLVDEHCLK